MIQQSDVEDKLKFEISTVNRGKLVNIKKYKFEKYLISSNSTVYRQSCVLPFKWCQLPLMFGGNFFPAHFPRLFERNSVIGREECIRPFPFCILGCDWLRGWFKPCLFSNWGGFDFD